MKGGKTIYLVEKIPRVGFLLYYFFYIYFISNFAARQKKFIPFVVLLAAYMLDLYVAISETAVAIAVSSWLSNETRKHTHTQTLH